MQQIKKSAQLQLNTPVVWLAKTTVIIITRDRVL
jgi:hypothetical protein